MNKNDSFKKGLNVSSFMSQHLTTKSTTLCIQLSSLFRKNIYSGSEAHVNKATLDCAAFTRPPLFNCYLYCVIDFSQWFNPKWRKLNAYDKLKPLTKTHHRNIATSIFYLGTSQRRSGEVDTPKIKWSER